MKVKWRLIIDGPGAPDWNMAVDRALLDIALEKATPPTLRLYWWEPPALSLGANQRGEDIVDWEGLEADGYGVVRRPTGGRAILHSEELTYSVVSPAPPGGIIEAYRWLAGGLQGGLKEAGINLDLERSRRLRSGRGMKSGEERMNPLRVRQPCFAAAGRYELVSGGRKVVGSAQYRCRGWLMQHGSILLGPDHLNLPRYLRDVDSEREIEKLKAATVDCSTLIGQKLEAFELLSPFTSGFARALGIALEEGELGKAERRRAELLRLHQFGNDVWIRHGIRQSALKDRSGD